VVLTVNTFVPVLYKLKDPVVVENHSSTLQQAMHAFLDCISFLVLLAANAIFQGHK
jgi:hypothetical protein